MAGRWRDPSAFRADPTATPAARPSRRQSLALVAVLVLVAGAVAIASYVIRPDRARAFDLFHGSLFLSDQSSPVAIDLASGKPTLRLVGADKQVSITGTDTLGLVPLDGGTLLLNQRTGEFNMVDSSGFVVKHDGGGVPVGGAADQTAATGVADGQLAYILRTGANRTDVYLVSQATVQSALSATTAVKPRASTTMDGIVASTGPGSAVAADGDLWLLGAATGQATDRHIIRQLRVPSDSSTGARLDSTDHGTVTGPVAIGTASSTDGSTAVGVATTRQIKVFDGSTSHSVTFAPAAGVDRILAAGNRGDRLGFLVHASNGWSLVSVRADGSQLRGPTRVAEVPAAADLVPPAYSGDTLYTMDKADGHLFRIGSDGRARSVPSEPTYPLGMVDNKAVEPSNIGDGYVVARGSRVIFNSPTHANALILFTDGSHPPMRIQKGGAVNVSASGGADQLTRSTVNPAGTGKAPAPGSKAPKPNPGQQLVNNKIDCKNVSQKPHIPAIDQVQAGSRSVTLTWTYPIIDKTQDCYPSTYVISVKLLSNTAPQPPGAVQVQSQVGTTITGLFPLTRYELTVTAYIKGQGTSSLPVQIRTGPEGPVAPTDLSVSADSSGNWILNWNSCGSIQQGCVAAQSWTVTPSFCDGVGLGAPPTPITSTADATSRHQPTVRYAGSDALLGRGLQFVVTGAGANQVPGTPSARSSCVYSWAPPLPSAMRLSASQPPKTNLGDSTTTNVTLDLGADPVRDVGGLGAKVTFTLTGNGATQTKSATFDGRSTSLSVNFGGVQAGITYTASALVQPAHGGAAVSIPSVDVSTRADWPNVGLDPTCAQNADGLSCHLTVQITGLTSSQARGEKFDFDGQLLCGVYGQGVSATNFDPANAIDGGDVSQLSHLFGTCSVRGTLKENPGSPAPEVFGGQPLSLGPTDVDLGTPSTSGAGQGDFQVSWGTTRQDGDVYAKINYTGSGNLRLTTNWSEVVVGPDGNGCGDPDGSDTPDTAVPVSAACIADAPSSGSWTVKVSYTERTTGEAKGPFIYSLPNPIPGYQYCTPTGFQAAWNTTKAQGVTVTDAGGDLSGCGGWAYELHSPQTPQSPCGTQGNNPPPATVPISCTDDVTQGTWTVVVSWVDSAGRSRTSDPVTVTGTPPPS